MTASMMESGEVNDVLNDGNVGKKARRIASIRVIDPGSKPDVDTDFHTEGRARVLDYAATKYGHDAVSNIITMGTFGAKQAFKDMCSIYEKNFQASNKITSLIPDPQEGENMTLTDIFNPAHDRYDEAEDFRERVSDPEWQPILQAAMALEGRVKSTGVHACGVLMSSQSLEGVLPTQVRQDDGKIISQWTYEDCEAIGLIKMDYLGLDTIDLIERTLDYIGRSGKVAPDIQEIIDGEMLDKKTLTLIRQGKTIGVFQIGKNPGVRDLLRKIKVDSVEDIIATTALFRPGPMGMNSHTRYAERKNGLEEIDYIHPDFDGSVLEEILSKTYGLVVFQEQILKIANKVGGMTLQEGDSLRKAMGKKQMDKMAKMKPKFFEGGTAQGFSEEALEKLWDTMVPFAKYAFNRSHSASYAIMAYLTAYLKANFPVEFMSAAIAGNIGNSNKKEQTLELMKETRRMKLKIGPVDANQSDIEVAPSLKGSRFDIVLGFSGIKAVSDSTAQKIVEEREKNGSYKSPENFLKRNIKNGINTKTIYESLTLAGVFDSFGYTRASIVESIPSLLAQEKKTQAKGDSLFASMGVTIESKAKMSKDYETEFSFSDKLKKEADVCGMYISAHPLDNAGKGMDYSGRTRVADLVDEKKSESIPAFKGVPVRLVGAITETDVKTARSGKKRYMFTVDDGTGYIEVRASGDIATAFAKSNITIAAENKRSNEGTMNLPLDVFVTDEGNKALLNNKHVPTIAEPKKNDVYILECHAIRRNGEVSLSLEDIMPLKMDKYGKLPARVRLTLSWLTDKEKLQRTMREVAQKFPGDTELWIANVSSISHEELVSGRELDIDYKDTKIRVDLSKEFIREMENIFTIDVFDLGITPNHNMDS